MENENKNTVRILKVGGASLSSASDVKRVVEIINRGNYQVVVASAFKGMTTVLEETADLFFAENPSDALDYFERNFVVDHYRVAKSLGVLKPFRDHIQVLKQELQEMTDVDTWISEPESKQNFLQFLLTFGERTSAEILNRYLGKHSRKLVVRKDARTVIVTHSWCPKTDGGFAPNIPETIENLATYFQRNHNLSQIVLMEGFIAAKNTNLGRNGSDTTLALVASAYQKIGFVPEVFYLKARAFETEKGNEISYEDLLLEQSLFPQPFVHEEAVQLLKDEGIPFCILSSKDPEYRLSVGNIYVSSSRSVALVQQE